MEHTNDNIECVPDFIVKTPESSGRNPIYPTAKLSVMVSLDCKHPGAPKEPRKSAHWNVGVENRKVNDQSQVRRETSAISPTLIHSAPLSRPRWLDDFSLLPPIYHRVIQATSTCYGLDSNIIYQILLSSGIPTPLVRQIWSLASQLHPGWLTPSELVVALALVGHVQHGMDSQCKKWDGTPTLEQLYSLSTPPIPRITISGTVPLAPAVSCAVLKHCTQIPGSSAIVFQPHASPSTGVFTASWSHMLHSPGQPSHTTNAVDDNWADFSSFVDSTISFTPSSSQSHQLLDHPNQILAVHVNPEANKPTHISPNIIDDDFGDFQTSRSAVGSPDFAAVSASLSPIRAHPKPVDSNTEKMLVLPNYNLTADLESIQSPVDTIKQEWLRCLSRCVELMQESFDVLAMLSSRTHRDEFVATAEGQDYLLDLVEVYRIVCRIHTAANKNGLLSNPLKSVLTELKELFHNHSQFAVTPELRTLWESVLTQLDSPSNVIHPLPVRTSLDHTATCGLCLIPLVQSDRPDDAVIALAGRTYHMPCANFWINQIQPSLPALVLP